jgi:hypothetical protein
MMLLMGVAGLAQAQTALTGNIISNTQLLQTQSPYLITGEVVIDQGAALTIEQGVTIYMAFDAALTVKRGSIRAIATEDNPITVTSDQIRQGQKASPGDWKHWGFQKDTVNTRLDYVSFEYGQGLAVYGLAPEFNYLTLKHHQGAAVTIDLAASPTGIGNTATGNDWNGIVVPEGEITGDITWGLRGIPYLLLAGQINVGVAPTITGLDPGALFVGQGALELKIQGRHFKNQSIVLINGVEQTTRFISENELRIDLTEPTQGLTVQVRTPDPEDVGHYLYSNEAYLPYSEPYLSITPDNSWTIQVQPQTLKVVLPYPAPAGGTIVTLVSSVPSVGTVPTFLSFNPGEKELEIQFVPQSLGKTTITASKSGFINGEARVTVLAAPALTFIPLTMRVGVERTLPVIIESTVPADRDGISLALTNSNNTAVSVPVTAKIPAGETQTTVNLTTLMLGDAMITASSAGFTDGQIKITVLPKSLLLPGAAMVAPGLTRSVPLTLTEPAPEGGVTATLTSADPAIATVPSSITVPSGQTSANFTLSGQAVGETTITATATGYQEATMPVIVEPIIIGIGSPTVSRITLSRETTESFPITISRPAPADGVVIQLSIADTSKATVTPLTITIPEGQTSGGAVAAQITGVEEGDTTLTASSPGLTAATVPVTVTKKAVLEFLRTSSAVGKGFKTYSSDLSVRRLVDGRASSALSPLAVTLASSDASRIRIPAMITIPANASSVSFQAEGIDVTDTPVMIDASALGHTPPETKASMSVVMPQFTVTGLATSRSVGAALNGVYLSVNVPGAYYGHQQTILQDTVFDLSIIDADPADIIDGLYSTSTGGSQITQVTWRAGYYNTYYGGIPQYVYIGSPKSAGTYKIKFDNAMLGGVTSVAVAVSGNLGLKFGRTSDVVGKGFKTLSSSLSVQRTVDGTAFNGAEALVVSLTSSDSSKLRVPATVTIPAGQSQATFQAEGIDVTDTEVLIDASALGHTPPETKASMSVVMPQFTITGLATSRSVGAALNGVYLSVNVPGAYYATQQPLAQDMVFDLSIIDADPADIIDGLYSTSTGGSQITQVTWRAGYYNTYYGGIPQYVYIGSPRSAGTYKIKFDNATLGGVTSAAVAVSGNLGLKFGRTSDVVGKGFKTFGSSLSVQRTVDGTVFNGVEALTVSLESSAPSVFNVPTTVTIPAGQSQVYFTVEGINLGSAMLTASATGFNPASDLNITVAVPDLVFNSPSNTRVGSTSSFNVYANTSGAYYPTYQTAISPITVNIVSSAPGVGTVPATVTIAAGSNSSNSASLTGVSPGQTILTASGVDLQSGQSNVITVSP